MLKIGGLQKLTLLDYPGKIAATLFLAGCNFRCGFCHNPDLVIVKQDANLIPEAEVLDFLKKRKGVLDGVCIGGGEPLFQPEIREFLAKIKDLGYLIKLDTNGFNSSLLEQLVKEKLIDYIAMDIKASLGKYEAFTGLKSDFKNIRDSIKLIMASGLPYEFRTTVLPKFHNSEEIEKIGQMISGAKVYFLQNFRNKITLDPALERESSFTDDELKELKQIALKYVKECEVRN